MVNIDITASLHNRWRSRRFLYCREICFTPEFVPDSFEAKSQAKPGGRGSYLTPPDKAVRSSYLRLQLFFR